MAGAGGAGGPSATTTGGGAGAATGGAGAIRTGGGAAGRSARSGNKAAAAAWANAPPNRAAAPGAGAGARARPDASTGAGAGAGAGATVCALLMSPIGCLRFSGGAAAAPAAVEASVLPVRRLPAAAPAPALDDAADPSTFSLSTAITRGPRPDAMARATRGDGKEGRAGLTATRRARARTATKSARIKQNRCTPCLRCVPCTGTMLQLDRKLAALGFPDAAAVNVHGAGRVGDGWVVWE
jgi:hypothetical protein